MQLTHKINEIQRSGMKVVVMVGSKSYQPSELSMEQLASERWEIKSKPVNRIDGIYRIIYLLEVI